MYVNPFDCIGTHAQKSEKYSLCFSTLQSIVRDLQQLCCLRPTDIPPFSIAKLPSLLAISPINLATECGHCADRRRRRSRDPVRVRPSVRPRPRAALPFLRRPSRMSMAIWPHSGLARGTLTKMDRSRKRCKTTRRYCTSIKERNLLNIFYSLGRVDLSGQQGTPDNRSI